MRPGVSVEQRSGGPGRRLRREWVHVDVDQVVAGLVEDVDRVLDLSDAGVGGAGFAGLVFLVPEVEVGAVIGEGNLDQGCGWAGPRGRPWIGTMPAFGRFVVQARDFKSIEHS